MKQFEYRDYAHYVDAQTKANVMKLDKKWVQQWVIDAIVKDYPDATTVLCHGTRNATEQKYFQDLLPKAEILGTEISHTADQFPMTVQHDFQEVLEDWVGKADIVYTNSFDHAMDPMKALETWKGQLSDNGVLYMEIAYTEDDNRSRESDPLELDSEEEFLSMITAAGMESKGVIVEGKKGSKVYHIEVV